MTFDPKYKPYRNIIRFNNDSLYFYTNFDGAFRLREKLDENGYLQKINYDFKGRVKDVFSSGGFPIPNQEYYYILVSIPFNVTIGSTNHLSMDCDFNIFTDTLRIVEKLRATF